MHARIPTPRRNASGGFGVHPHRMCARIPTLRRKPVGVFGMHPLLFPVPGTEMAGGRVCPREHGPCCPLSGLSSFELFINSIN